MLDQPFTMIEEEIRKVDPSIEVYRCDYEDNCLKKIVIRFPAENGINLMQMFMQAGWTPEKQEVRGNPCCHNKGIQGWLPAEEGKKYLRMSAAAGACSLPGVSQTAS